MENKNFTFSLGVSEKGNSVKPTKFNNINYQKKIITLEEFSELVIKGHLFCHNYKNFLKFNVKKKTIDNFHHTNLIWIDFDKSTFTFKQAYDEALIKPTFSYTTMSNSETENRFRFIYIFKDQISSNEEYLERSNLLMNMIFSKSSIDKIIGSVDMSCFKSSQQFLGSKADCQFEINPENIITMDMLNEYFSYGLFKSNTSISDNPNVEIKNCFSFSDSLSNNTFKSNISSTFFDIQFRSYDDLFEKITLKEYVVSKCHKNFNNPIDEKKRETSLQNKQNMTDVIDKTLKLYNNKEFIPLLNNYENAVYSDDIYTYVGDQDIYNLNTYFGKGKKVKIGKRTKTLYFQALVLKNIEPNLRLEDMSANLLWLVYHHYENPNEIKLNVIVHIAINALKTDEYTWKCGKRQYLLKEKMKNLTKSEKQKHLGKARKKKRDNDILPNYNSNLSVAKNAELLGKSIGTVYKSLNENHINIKNNSEYLNFRELYYNSSSEIRTVRKMGEISGISRGKSERFINRIKSELSFNY